MEKGESRTRDEFPRGARIPKRREITGLQQRGKKIFSKGFLVCYRIEPGSESRMAVTVSKKVHKRAVVRNRIKRRVREIFRRLRRELPPGTAMVIIARGSAVECSFAECEAQILRSLASHGLIKR
ncbi:ribonuclease P protein component [bacterium]|nr:ribonuclease P protein component [bacterium]